MRTLRFCRGHKSSQWALSVSRQLPISEHVEGTALFYRRKEFMDTTQKRGKPFAVGNRLGKGRPPGRRNKAMLLLEEIMEGEAPAAGRKFMELVGKGVMPAIKMYMDRVYPLQRDRPVQQI